MSHIVVSVIMITYGHEKYIRDAINGFLMQQVSFNLELIIADDCSPDDTESIVKSFSNHPKYSWIKYTRHKENKGMMPNFIWALQESSGKYIALCEGDDYWTDPYKLQKQVDFLEGNEEYVVCGHDAKIINNLGFTIKDSKLPLEFKRDASSHELKKGFWILTLSMVFRNVPILKTYPKESCQVSNGDIFLISMLGNYGKYKYLDQIEPAVYRIHEGGVWSLKSSFFKFYQNLNTKTQLAKYYKNRDKNVSLELFHNNWVEGDRYFIKTKIAFNYKIKLLKIILYNMYYSKGLLKCVPYFIKRSGRLILAKLFQTIKFNS